MNIQSKKFGKLQTYSYILSMNVSSIIIDPGEDSLNWIVDNSYTIEAIFLTHAHYDHIASLKNLCSLLSVPIYLHILDKELLYEDFSEEEINNLFSFIEEDSIININGFDEAISFLHVPGHTLGSSLIQYRNHVFSGDLIFDNTIGRHNYWNSSIPEMYKSLKKFYNLYNESENEIFIYPGHNSLMTFELCSNVLTEWMDILLLKVKNLNTTKASVAVERQKSAYLFHKNN